MEITLLGTGTAVPEAERLPASALVRTAEQSVLIDIGPGVLRQVARAGLDVAELDTVLITHFHTDHTSDLPALLFALRSPRFAKRPPLHIYGPPGLHSLLQHLTAAWPWVDPEATEYHLLVRELQPGPFEMGGLTVTAIPVEHTDSSLGYRLTADGGTVAFTGDAGACDGVVELGRGADLLVCDCAFPDGAHVPGHMTPSLAGQMAAKADCKKLVLTHCYPECDGHDLVGAARGGDGWSYPGEVIQGTDLQTFQLP